MNPSVDEASFTFLAYTRTYNNNFFIYLSHTVSFYRNYTNKNLLKTILTLEQ